MKNRTKGIIQLISAFIVPIILWHACAIIGGVIGFIIEIAVTGDVKDFSGYLYAGLFIGGSIGLLVSIIYFVVMLSIGIRNMKAQPGAPPNIASQRR
jgi:hypothetical protein